MPDVLPDGDVAGAGAVLHYGASGYTIERVLEIDGYGSRSFTRVGCGIESAMKRRRHGAQARQEMSGRGRKKIPAKESAAAPEGEQMLIS